VKLFESIAAPICKIQYFPPFYSFLRVSTAYFSWMHMTVVKAVNALPFFHLTKTPLILCEDRFFENEMAL
jgi:hypothetical protein